MPGGWAIPNPRKDANELNALADRIAAEMEQGASLRGACGICGVSHTLVLGWVARAADGEPYASFADRIKGAQARAIGRAEQYVYGNGVRDEDGKASDYDWTRRARWLESMSREDWIRREARDLTLTAEINIPFPEAAEAGHAAAEAVAKAAAGGQ